MKYLLCTVFISFSLTCSAQNKDALAVKFIDGIVNELLDQLTIEKGERMDTAAIRNLFHPGAQLTLLNPGEAAAETVSLDDFLSLLVDPYYEQGYLEKEISKVVDEYNGIA